MGVSKGTVDKFNIGRTESKFNTGIVTPNVFTVGKVAPSIPSMAVGFGGASLPATLPASLN